jgi:DHA1 family bicyclomycin/chloramphenicol resistance-like MFS transporter
VTEVPSKRLSIPVPIDDIHAHVPQGWRLVLIIGGLSIFGPLCIDAYLPSLPRIASDLHATTSSVQLTITACLIGIACGQLLIGPISDRQGRRPPLVFGIGAFVAASLACTLVSNVYVLDGLRFVQGIGGAAGIVISRAIVRDLFEGVTASRFFSTLVLVTGIGPLLAPQLGSEILKVTSWRGVFVFLAAVAAALLTIAMIKVPETLPPERRHVGGLRHTMQVVGVVGRDPSFVAYALIGALGLGAVFAYIAGSPFVLQDIYGLSPQMFGVVFALIAVGLIGGSQVNGYFVRRLGSSWLLTAGLILMAVGGVLLLVAVTSRWLGLWTVIPALFSVLFGLGLVSPNAMALAMQDHANSAGVASALLGSSQFLLGAAVAPLVGLGGNHDALPMGLVMAGLTGAALVVRITVHRREASLVVVAEPTPAVM